MNLTIIVFVILISLGLTRNGHGEEHQKWLCIADAATGFSYRDGKWRATKFNVEDSKYIVTKHDVTGVYNVTKVGERIGMKCGANDPDLEGWLTCEGIFKNWRMNIKSLSVRPEMS